MNKITTSFLITLLGFSANCLSMEKKSKNKIKKEQRKSTTIPVVPETIFDNPLMQISGASQPSGTNLTSIVQTPKSESSSQSISLYSDFDDTKLCTLFFKISLELTQAKNAKELANDSKRKERKEVYDTLLKRNQKSDVKKMLCGIADDFSDDEKDLDSLTENETDWKRFYENSKKKTDKTIATIKISHEATTNTINELETSEKEQDSKIEDLEKMLEAAKKQREEILKSKNQEMVSKENFGKALTYYTKRKDQNEELLKMRRDGLTKQINEHEEEIRSIESDLKELSQTPKEDYEKSKKRLLEDKEKTLEKKKELEKELISVDYYLPKINQPGSYTRTIKSYIGW